MRSIPLARAARRRHGLTPPIVRPDGTLDARDAAAARWIAARLNEARTGRRAAVEPEGETEPARAGAAPAGTDAAPAGAVVGTAADRAVSGGEVTALAALHAILHRVVEREWRSGRADLDAAARAARHRVGRRSGEVALAYRSAFGPDDRPTASRPRIDGRRLADLLVLSTLNDDAAAAPLRELVDDRPLRDSTPYDDFVRAATTVLAGGDGGPARGRVVSPLPALLRQPIDAAPTSLVAQLRWVRENWADLLADAPDLLERLVLALDVAAEEARALELQAAAGAFGGGGAVEVPEYHGLDPEHDAFSSDTDWMPSVVLMAKSTYVWLEQLARAHGRPIRTLADVPDEELDRLAGLGITGLWLIGLWERSRASAEIKRRRGDPDAVASAYAIDDYRIADDLGGEAAFEALKGRAWARGIRMAADMVPNHMGIDSRWVVEHPERFTSVPVPPFPSYSFTGPDLSPDPRVEITIEDHYWDASDAAVVFRRRDRASGETRFIYHGNDGTSFPWNDTAQLDYLRREVREAVIRTILAVARRAPILRFDAAMVLAKRHIRRLWFPEPGAGGAIPSRAEHAMSAAAFERAMPHEFWREVVDRVASAAPGTLLLAEAFWLLEGYFVRTLGMHRVYNSAFMHMLRDEDNAGYRRVMRDTLEFDPGVLQRFVNFLTNPDERPAAEQFGTGDKAFSAMTLLATLPGLPMLGHGQVEGFRERYGMEFRRARWDEPVDRAHAEHVERMIVPLLRRRADFSGVERFLLYDATAANGEVVEDVYAYSNGGGDRRSLVLVHHRQATVEVRIDRSVPYSRRELDGSRSMAQGRLAEALELPADDGARIRFRDPRTGWETTRTAGELRHDGLRVILGPYEALVLSIDEVREERPTADTAAVESGPPAGTTPAAKPRRSPRRHSRPKAPGRRTATPPRPSRTSPVRQPGPGVKTQGREGDGPR